jgi:hypothetical protein
LRAARNAYRDPTLVAWVVLWDLPAYPERYAARLATSTASPYLMLADTLAGIQAQFLIRLIRQSRSQWTRWRWRHYHLWNGYNIGFCCIRLFHV